MKQHNLYHALLSRYCSPEIGRSLPIFLLFNFTPTNFRISCSHICLMWRSDKIWSKGSVKAFPNLSTQPYFPGLMQFLKLTNNLLANILFWIISKCEKYFSLIKFPWNYLSEKSRLLSFILDRCRAHPNPSSVHPAGNGFHHAYLTVLKAT